MRISEHLYYMQVADAAAMRSTCVKKAVGCVLVDVRGKILATGYNGPPSCFRNCCDLEKPYCENKDVSENNYINCIAVHAEQNALMQCADVSKIEAAYVTLLPCFQCLKMLLNTKVRTIVFKGDQKEVSKYTSFLSNGKFTFCKLISLEERLNVENYDYCKFLRDMMGNE